MVKENKLSPFILFLIATSLLTAAWLMRSFPVFIFFGFAPLFALTDRVKKEEIFWESFEWILIAICVSLFAAHLFRTSFLPSVFVQGIAFTIAFIAYKFVKQALGDYLGKVTILFFWLAIEYLLLQLHWPASSLFLGDVLSLQKNWLHWNIYTGYLGASFWILLVNLFLYYSYFKTGKINWYLFILFLVSLAAPIVFSYIKGGKALDRETMVSFYKNGTITAFPSYEKQAEIVAKASAWISVVILVVAFVRHKTSSK